LGNASSDSRTLKLAPIILVAALMGLNPIGIYGYLSRAHIEHALAGDLAVAGRAADVEARLALQAGVVSDLDRRIAQIDSAVDESTRRGRTASAMNLVDQQRHKRGNLVAAREQGSKTLAALQVEKAGIDGLRKAVEADLGPVRYLAMLLGAYDEARYFILSVALLLDPSAVLLLLAATARRLEPPSLSGRGGRR
jgi:hypothetical protein